MFKHMQIFLLFLMVSQPAKAASQPASQQPASQPASQLPAGQPPSQCQPASQMPSSSCQSASQMLPRWLPDAQPLYIMFGVHPQDHFVVIFDTCSTFFFDEILKPLFGGTLHKFGPKGGRWTSQRDEQGC